MECIKTASGGYADRFGRPQDKPGFERRIEIGMMRQDSDCKAVFAALQVTNDACEEKSAPSFLFRKGHRGYFSIDDIAGSIYLTVIYLH